MHHVESIADRGVDEGPRGRGSSIASSWSSVASSWSAVDSTWSCIESRRLADVARELWRP